MRNRLTYRTYKKPSLIFGVLIGLWLILNSSLLKAQTYHHLELSGFNKDVIAEYTPANSSSDQPIDWPSHFETNMYNFSLPTQNVVLILNDSSLAGIPENGLIDSEITSSLSFQLQPFDGNNSLWFNEWSNQEKTLTVSNGIPLQKIYLLVTSGDGEVEFDIDIKFSDNTTYSVGTFEVPDWQDSSPPAGSVAFSKTAGISRTPVSNEFLIGDNPPYNTSLYQIEIDFLPIHYNKTITEVTFKPGILPHYWYGDGFFHVFAITGLELSDCTEPITVNASGTQVCTGVSVVLEAMGYSTIYFQGTNPDGEADTLGGAIVEVDEPGTYYFRAFDQIEDCWGSPMGITIFGTYGPENISASAEFTEVCLGSNIQLYGNADYPGLGNTIYEANDYSQFQYWTPHYKYENHNDWYLNYTGGSPLGSGAVMRYDYIDNFTGYIDVKNYIQSHLINGSAYSNIKIQFRHYLDDYNKSIFGSYIYEIRAEVSVDNINWEILYNSGITNGDIGPQLLTYNLNTTYNYEQFYLRFVVEGDETGMWYWDIDDIKVTGNPTANIEYNWEGPNGFTSTDQNPVILNAQPQNFGVYTLTVSYGICSPKKTVVVEIKQCEAFVNPNLRNRVVK